MKKLFGVGLALALVAMTALAQPGAYKVHTRPQLPSREALERMGLKMAWQARLLLRGDRDGFLSVQLLPGEDNPQVLVQSYSGLVALFDGETGDQLWQTQVGERYKVGVPAGWNSRSIFVIRRNVLHVLNRANGLQRVFDVNKTTGVRTNGVELPYPVSAAPVSDDVGIYFVMGKRVLAYELPTYETIDKLVKAGQSTAEIVADLLENPLWSFLGDEVVPFPAMLAVGQLSIATDNGTLLSLNKFNRKVRDEFDADGKIVAPPGQHGVMAYIGTEKASLYAYNMDNSKLAWRFLPGGAIRQQPAVTDRDVFVASDPLGLFRVRRGDGREIWLAKQLDRFLAANDNFVYALHHSGELHVLDYLRGSTMARYDMRDWTIPVLNDQTDRVYLAANDGQIICLRHRDLKNPLRMRVPPPPPPKKDDKKKDEPKDDKEKDKDKEKEKDKDKALEEARSLGACEPFAVFTPRGTTTPLSPCPSIESSVQSRRGGGRGAAGESLHGPSDCTAGGEGSPS